MKYTISQDGVERTTVRIEIRLTREEIEILKARAKQENAEAREINKNPEIIGGESFLLDDDWTWRKLIRSECQAAVDTILS